MKKSNIAFIQIPYAVLYSKELNDFQKIMYGQIYSLTKQKGYCFATNNKLGQLLNKRSKATISIAVKKLTDLGFICCESMPGNFRRITIVKDKITDFDHSEVFSKNDRALIENDTSSTEKLSDSRLENDKNNIYTNRELNTEKIDKERRMKNSSLTTSLREASKRLEINSDSNIDELPKLFAIREFIDSALETLDEVFRIDKTSFIYPQNIFKCILSFANEINDLDDYLDQDVSELILDSIVKGVEGIKKENYLIEIDEQFSTDSKETHQFIVELYTSLLSQYANQKE